MPTAYGYELCPRAVRALWAQITQELLAKGLVEGTGKFTEVMYRHFNKRKGKLPARTYVPIKKGRFH